MSDAYNRSHVPNEETRQAMAEAESTKDADTIRFATVDELMADLARDTGGDDEKNDG